MTREEFPVNVNGPVVSLINSLYCPNCGHKQEVSTKDIYIPHSEVYSRNMLVKIEKSGPPDVKFEFDCKNCNGAFDIFCSDPIA